MIKWKVNVIIDLKINFKTQSNLTINFFIIIFIVSMAYVAMKFGTFDD